MFCAQAACADVERLVVRREAGAARTDFVKLPQLFRRRAGAGHAFAEFSAMQFAAAEFTDAAQDFFLLAGDVAREPFGENRLHREGQAHDGVVCAHCARFARGGEECGDFVVVQAGDDRRGEHGDGDSGGGEFADRGEPARRRAGAGFECFCEGAVERGEGDRDAGGVEFCEFAEQVGVSGDEVIFCDQRDGVAEFREDFEATPRDLHSPLDGLVHVGDAAHGDGLRRPAFFRERLAEEIRRAVFDQDAALEFDACAEAEILMVGSREAVCAAVLAAAVGRAADAERDVRRVIPRQDALRVVAEKLRADGEGIAVVVHERAGLDLDALRVEAVRRIDARAATGRGGRERGIGWALGHGQ